MGGRIENSGSLKYSHSLNPAAGVYHARSCFRNGRHVVMVNVEADALIGAMLAREAKRSGVVYSLAYGDQPALICEMVDWARASGFEVVAAGKGTKYLPAYHESTPQTVWEHYGFSPEQLRTGDFNPRMFNSFLDGTKSAIEMAAVANATGLTPPRDGLGFPPAGVDDLANVCRPARDGGALHDRGVVEVVSCLNRDGSPVARDIRMGVYVTIEATSEYVRSCFSEYGLAVDDSGAFAAMYKPFHLIGLELGISIASVALRNEPTGRPSGVARRRRSGGQARSRIGGSARCRRRIHRMGQARADRCVPGPWGALPIGLAEGARLASSVSRGDVVRWQGRLVVFRVRSINAATRDGGGVSTRRRLRSGADKTGRHDAASPPRPSCRAGETHVPKACF